MQRHKARNPSSRHMLDMAHRLSCLLAGGTDPLAFLRTILQDALALTNSGGGAVLLLERNLRLLRPLVDVSAYTKLILYFSPKFLMTSSTYWTR